MAEIDIVKPLSPVWRKRSPDNDANNTNKKKQEAPKQPHRDSAEGDGDEDSHIDEYV